MPIQTLSPKINAGSMLGQAIGQGLNTGINRSIEEQSNQRMLNQQLQKQQQFAEYQNMLQQKQMQQQAQQQQSALYDSLNKVQQIYANPNLTAQQKQIGLYQALNSNPGLAKALSGNLQNIENQTQTQRLLQGIYGPQQEQAPLQQIPMQNVPSNVSQAPVQPQEPQAGQFDPRKITDLDIAEVTSYNPNLGKLLQQQKDTALRENREQEKIKRKEFESEREYHTGFSKELEKEINRQREVIPKKENSLNLARNAVESGNLGYFSLDKLADATGVDLFRTAKGSQLITASKENLLNNMGRVSARAQNIWFEQRLNSMFPKIGQSTEANLTVQEMLEGELALDKAYLKEFDRLSQEDESRYGYVKKDVSRRAHQAIKPLEGEIFKRTTYRMKEIEEQEKGLNSLKKEIGKKVPKGTPMTLAMAKLYKDKFEDKALEVALNNGYYVPSIEEFKLFQQSPQEFRE